MTSSNNLKVGILGGGQLGLMLALAGRPLGIECSFIDPAMSPAAASVARHVRAPLDDVAHLDRMAASADVVTYELEGVPLTSALYLENSVPVRPGVRALETSQDRLFEKQAFEQNGIPTAPWMSIEADVDIDAAAESFGYPLLLKQRRGGYDGHGQTLIRSADERRQSPKIAGRDSCIVEGCVRFDRELSLVAVRALDGRFSAYPLVENHHHNGILRVTIAPAPFLDSTLQRQAEEYALRSMESLDYVGVCALEFFQVENTLIANEMAPRVHNSGHWTIEGSNTSQFENHLRAILGLPLGSTKTTSHAVMINLVGDLPDLRSVLSVKGAALHLYGKDPRPNRKLGHVTLRAAGQEELRQGLQTLRSLYPAENCGFTLGIS